VIILHRKSIEEMRGKEVGLVCDGWWQRWFGRGKV